MNNKIRWIGIVRILGLTLVLTYHYFKERLPGGFIGVDVFFTFSGYLITALAVSEIKNTGGFKAVSFYERRFKRIYPPLLLSVIFTLPFALLISPDFTAGIQRQAAAALSFVTNFYEIQTGGSYEAKLFPHLFVHTWFLGIEVHLYIITGLLIKVLSIPLKNKPGLFAAFICVLSLELAALSYIYAQISYGANGAEPAMVYFNTLSRSYPFFIGCAAGALFGTRPYDSIKRISASAFVRVISICLALSSAAGLYILAVKLDYTSPATYRSGILLASSLTVVIIYAMRFWHEALPDNIKEPKLISVIAGLSYCIFLFHWPLYIIFSNMLFINSNAAAAGVSLGVSAVLAAFVFYCVEPLLHGKQHYKQKRQIAAAYASLSLMLTGSIALCSLVIYRAPVITSIEHQIYIDLMYQDYDRIYAVKKIEDALNDTPLILEAMPVMADLSLEISQEPPVSPDTKPGSNSEAQPPASEPDPDAQQTGAPGAQQPTSSANLPELSTQELSTVKYLSEYDPNKPDYILEGVTVIGDSVCLGARKTLIDTIPNCDVDAAGNRQIWQGHKLLLEMQEASNLAEYIVIALGTNANRNYAESIENIIADMRPGHRLIFVTPFNGKLAADSITNQSAQYIRTLPDIYPFVTVADWAGIEGLKDIIRADYIHIAGNKAATTLYVNNIINAINEAALKPAIGDEPIETADNRPIDLDLYNTSEAN